LTVARRAIGSFLAERPRVREKAVKMSRYPTDAGQAVRARTVGAHAPEVHVLVADGDETSRRLRELQLRTAGFRVSLAPTAFAAIVKASCHMPDVILLDECLGDMGTSETLRLITTCPVTAHIPVLRLAPGRPLPRRVLTIVRQAALASCPRGL
jgi:PleD family two-component response regulator